MPKKAKAKNQPKAKGKSPPNSKAPMPVQVRWMTSRDMEEMLAIEAECFAQFDEEDLVNKLLRLRTVRGIVAENYAGRIVGFTIYRLYPARVHVLRFAVRKQWRRRGVGMQMVQQLKGKLAHHRRTSLSIEVRERHLEGQLFLRSQQFRAVKVLREYFDDTDEDAYLMHHFLGEPTAIPAVPTR